MDITWIKTSSEGVLPFKNVTTSLKTPFKEEEQIETDPISSFNSLKLKFEVNKQFWDTKSDKLCKISDPIEGNDSQVMVEHFDSEVAVEVDKTQLKPYFKA